MRQTHVRTLGDLLVASIRTYLYYDDGHFYGLIAKSVQGSASSVGVHARGRAPLPTTSEDEGADQNRDESADDAAEGKNATKSSGSDEEEDDDYDYDEDADDDNAKKKKKGGKRGKKGKKGKRRKHG